MALNKTQTATEVVAALNGLPIDATSQQRWEAAIEVIYTRIKADMIVASQVASGINVTIPSTSGPGSPSTGATSATGTATSQTIS
jgi:hypothetical protein